MTIHSDAAEGTLTDQSLLDQYLQSCKINDVSNEKGNGTFGLTPLAVSAMKGHVDVVKLLLEKKNNADPNGLSTHNRTPLWITTHRGSGDGRLEIISMLLKAGAKVDATDPELNNDTPLVNELRQRKDPDVIKLLVDNKASTKDAQAIADKLDDPAITDAMLPKWQRSKLRTEIVSLLVALILFIIAWANSQIVNGVVSEVTKRVHKISGDMTSQDAKKIEKEIPATQSKEAFKTSVNDFVTKNKLNKFFPKSDTPFLKTLTEKAVDLQNDPSTLLGAPHNIQDLTRLSLYQPVIYCDDSGSMGYEGRAEAQKDLVKRIAVICTRLVPDNVGVHLRFINADRNDVNDLRMDGIEKVISEVPPSGYTEIGLNLKKKILKPLVYDKIKSGGSLERPLLISIITDGVPGGDDRSLERLNTLKDTVLECTNFLQANRYPSESVVFLISQIGSDSSSKEFLDSLRTDSSLSRVLHCTAEQLDAKYKELKNNEKTLEEWLFRKLMAPITSRARG